MTCSQNIEQSNADKIKYYGTASIQGGGDPELTRYEEGVGTYTEFSYRGKRGGSFLADFDARNFHDPVLASGIKSICTKRTDTAGIIREHPNFFSIEKREERLRIFREIYDEEQTPAYFVRLMVDEEEDIEDIFRTYRWKMLDRLNYEEEIYPFPFAPGVLTALEAPKEVTQLDGIFARLGAKSYLRDKIIGWFPDHFAYMEPFFGSGKVLLGKEKQSQVEIVNDIDRYLVTFLMYVKEFPEEIVERINSFPTSEYLFKKWSRETDIKKMTPFMQAVVFYYISKLCFNAKIRSDTSTYGSSPFGQLNHRADLQKVLAVSKRLQRVDIRCVSFEKFIKAGNKEVKGKVFFYCDSPYHETSGYHSLTDVLGYGDKEHILLRDLLVEVHKTGNLFMMTNSATPFIKELYKDFYQYEAEVEYSVSGGSGEKAKEVIVTNYDVSEIENKRKNVQGGLF